MSTFMIGDPDHTAEHNRQRIVESVPAGALKAHRVDPLTFAAPDVWVPVEFQAIPADEQLAGLFLRPDNITVESEVSDIFMVSGCARPLWSGGANGVATLASRIMNSTDGGVTFVENRCLQAIQGRARQVGEVGTMHYIGTVGCEPGTLFRLEVRTSDTDLSLAGSPVFDSPVSVSIQAHGMGRLAHEGWLP